MQMQRIIIHIVLMLCMCAWAGATQCTFLGIDNLTLGNWNGVYGTLGYKMVDARVGQPVQELNHLPTAAPTFSPCAGTYSSAQTVAICSSIDGATIRYTINGTTPSATVGNIYTGPISITANTTLKAVAYLDGQHPGDAASGMFAIRCAVPTFTPVADTYDGTRMVTMRCATGGATIRYTTDGTTPTAVTGAIYAGPIRISANTTLQAIAYKKRLTESTLATGTFYLRCAPPVLTPGTGIYRGAQTVKITCETPGATIRYTTDGRIPSAIFGTHYTGPITINATEILHAVASKHGMADSAMTITQFTILADGSGKGQLTGSVLGTPGSYDDDPHCVKEMIFDGDPATFYTGASSENNWCGMDFGMSHIITKIHFTPRLGFERRMVGGVFQGSNTADFSSNVVDLYTIKETPPAGWSTITAIASTVPFRYVRYVSLPGTYGDVAEIEFYSQAGAPVFTAVDGAKPGSQLLAIHTTTRSATIRYTTDGTPPSRATGTVYTAPVKISAGNTLKAIAYMDGMADSPITAGVYPLMAK